MNFLSKETSRSIFLREKSFFYCPWALFSFTVTVEIWHSTFVGLWLEMNEMIYEEGFSFSQGCWKSKTRDGTTQPASPCSQRFQCESALLMLTSVTSSGMPSFFSSAESILGDLFSSWVLPREAVWGLRAWTLQSGGVQTLSPTLCNVSRVKLLNPSQPHLHL